jgi:hypothetical protein
VTWKPALTRLFPRAEVAAPSASDRSRILGPVLTAADATDRLTVGFDGFGWR